MKKLTIAIIAAGTLLSGCVAYAPAHPGPDYAHRDRDRDGVADRFDRDRDGDGIRNRNDRYPNNPRYY